MSSILRFDCSVLHKNRKVVRLPLQSPQLHDGRRRPGHLVPLLRLLRRLPTVVRHRARRRRLPRPVGLLPARLSARDAQDRLPGRAHKAVGKDLYRVAHLVANLGWVDLNFDYSTVCLILPGLMGVWQKRLGSWARWWNCQIQVNRTQVRDQMGQPVANMNLS